MPKDAAAELKGFNQFSAYGAVAGLNRRATRATGGAISLSISIHLPAIVGSIFMKPVTLPGSRTFATKPFPIGSDAAAKRSGWYASVAAKFAVVRACHAKDQVGLQRDEFLGEPLSRLRIAGRRPALLSIRMLPPLCPPLASGVRHGMRRQRLVLAGRSRPDLFALLRSAAPRQAAAPVPRAAMSQRRRAACMKTRAF